MQASEHVPPRREPRKAFPVFDSPAQMMRVFPSAIYGDRERQAPPDPEEGITSRPVYPDQRNRAAHREMKQVRAGNYSDNQEPSRKGQPASSLETERTSSLYHAKPQSEENSPETASKKHADSLRSHRSEHVLPR